MDDEEIVTTTDISTEVSLQVTSELPFTVTAQQKTTPGKWSLGCIFDQCTSKIGYMQRLDK